MNAYLENDPKMKLFKHRHIIYQSTRNLMLISKMYRFISWNLILSQFHAFLMRYLCHTFLIPPLKQVWQFLCVYNYMCFVAVWRFITANVGIFITDYVRILYDCMASTNSDFYNDALPWKLPRNCYPTNDNIVRYYISHMKSNRDRKVVSKGLAVLVKEIWETGDGCPKTVLNIIYQFDALFEIYRK